MAYQASVNGTFRQVTKEDTFVIGCMWVTRTYKRWRTIETEKSREKIRRIVSLKMRCNLAESIISDQIYQ